MSLRALRTPMLVATVGLVLALPAGAQTRHDDKPHGAARPAEKSSPYLWPNTSGRHADMMHGPKSMRGQGAHRGADPAPAAGTAVGDTSVRDRPADKSADDSEQR